MYYNDDNDKFSSYFLAFKYEQEPLSSREVPNEHANYEGKRSGNNIIAGSTLIFYTGRMNENTM